MTAVLGELSFTVDGPGGATSGTVSGRGGTVAVHADDPVAAWDAALGSVSTGPAALQAIAGLLHDEGLVVELSGPAGLVATVGSGVNSPVGALLAGSRRIRLGTPAAVRPLAVAQVRRSAAAAPGGRPALLALATLLFLVLAGRLRRRR